MYLDGENRRSLTPQLAFRVAIIGGVALLAFGVIFFRLWYLQVLSGDKYEAKANDNRVREIKVQAPRGEVVDRDGRVLVDNRTGLAVKVTPGKLPDGKGERMEIYSRLAGVLGSSAERIDRSVSGQLKALPYSAATVKQDVKPNVVAYLLERQKDFPGVTVERVFLRKYPHRQVGAHLFGTVGEITKEQLDDQRYRGVGLGDRVGQSGIEYQYDRFLRGKNGASRVQVDALGSLKGELSVKRPVQGRQLRLSVDLGVQKVGQQALGGAKGAFAVMNVRNGQMVALGSTPSFDPNLFSKIIRPRDFKRLSSEELGKPLFSRATQGGYPTGSTYKLITSVAGLEGGLITPDTVQYDGGSITVGGVRFQNAGGVVNGPVALRKALTVSSDVYYYLVGREANGSGDGLLLQRWARRLGIGRRTGIDLPSESPGFVPSPKWRNQLFKRKLTDRPWSVGDNINLSVGQGDLAANPLQMAVAYSTVANGGRLLRPRLGLRIEDAGGRALQQLETPSPRRVKIKPENRQAIMEGLRGAASAPGGTSTPVFKGFPVPVAGKTGTAEKGAGRADQSWYVALAPYPNPKYVVAVTFEAGGFGAETAAPAARRIMGELFGVKGDAKKQVQGGTAPD
ncbi:MAG: penicillin-binding protein 2 [Actinomycetota bacterium]|nr:penicillin-binding protein 2 [Actinomycetota bacterium]MDQ3720028.1 penicillin-binding protein 2 [Actinomycetota bacterium]